MKTKILSLALALMMIISVAAALPVSAVTQAELDGLISGTDYIKLSTTTLSTTAGAADYASGSFIYDWAPTGDVDWDHTTAKKGTFRFHNTSAYIQFTCNAENEGFYDLYVAAGHNTDTGKISVTVNGKDTVTYSVPNTGSDTVKKAEVSVGTFYLNQGSNTVKFHNSNERTHMSAALFLKNNEIVTYKITAQAGAGGNVAGGGTVEEGESVTLTATPTSDYLFDGWYNELGEKVSSAASYTITDVQANATYTAKFKAGVILDLGTATRPNGVGGGPVDAVQTDPNSWIIGKMYLLNGASKQKLVFEEVTLPEDGLYNIYFGAAYYWSGHTGDNFRMNILDGEEVIASNLAVGNVEGYSYKAAKSVKVASVYLKAGKHEITVAATAGVVALVGMKFEEAASYTITAVAETGGTVEGSGTYIEGETVTLNASANAGYKFIGWFDGENLASEDAAYTFTATENKTYTAKFEEATSYTITAVAETGGTVAGSGKYTEDTSVTLTATANSGYEFIGWYDDDVLVSEDAAYTFTATENKTYTAKFKVGVVYVNVPLNGGTIIKQVTISSTGDTHTNKPTGVGWATQGGIYVFSNLTNGRALGASKEFNVDVAGWYKVLVAAGGYGKEGEIKAQVYVNGAVAEGNLALTGGMTTVASNELSGYVYLKQGSNTLKNYILNKSYITKEQADGSTKKETQHAYIYDVRFECVSTDPDAKDIIINTPDYDGVTGIGTDTHFRAFGTDSTEGQWTPTGGITISNNSYTVYVPSSGYYNLYVSAATDNFSKISVNVNDVEYVDSLYLNSTHANWFDVAETHVAKVYLKAGNNIISISRSLNSGDYYIWGMKLSKTSDTLTAGDLKLVGNGGLDLSTPIYEGTNVFGEIVTTQDAKIIVVNYAGSGDTKRMVSYTEGTAVVTDNGLKIIRTSEALESSAGTVKVFLWSNDGECIPLEVPVEVTINAVPTEE